jgi:hypothetical protein
MELEGTKKMLCEWDYFESIELLYIVCCFIKKERKQERSPLTVQHFAQLLQHCNICRTHQSTPFIVKVIAQQ